MDGDKIREIHSLNEKINAPGPDYLLEKIKTIAKIRDPHEMQRIMSYLFRIIRENKLSTTKTSIVALLVDQDGIIEGGITEISRELSISMSSTHPNVYELEQLKIIKCYKAKGKIIIHFHPDFIEQVIISKVKEIR